jgi:hypothetical protein
MIETPTTRPQGRGLEKVSKAHRVREITQPPASDVADTMEFDIKPTLEAGLSRIDRSVGHAINQVTETLRLDCSLCLHHI